MPDNGIGMVASIHKPYQANQFWVEIDGVADVYFTEFSGIQITTEVFEYREGGVNAYTHKLPVRTTYANATLKHGMTKDQKMWDWYMKTVSGKIETKNISIILYSPLSPATEGRRWDLIKAYPVKWLGPSLVANSNEYTIESLEIAFETAKATAQNLKGM